MFLITAFEYDQATQILDSLKEALRGKGLVAGVRRPIQKFLSWTTTLPPIIKESLLDGSDGLIPKKFLRIQYIYFYKL